MNRSPPAQLGGPLPPAGNRKIQAQNQFYSSLQNGNVGMPGCQEFPPFLSPAGSSCPHIMLLSKLLPWPLAAVKSSPLKPLFFLPRGKHGLTFFACFLGKFALVQLRRALWCLGRAPQRDGDPHSVQLGLYISIFLIEIYFYGQKELDTSG